MSDDLGYTASCGKQSDVKKVKKKIPEEHSHSLIYFIKLSCLYQEWLFIYTQEDSSKNWVYYMVCVDILCVS